MNDTINIFWFRRDLRLNDNHGLYQSLKSGKQVLPVFIFDSDILNKLPDDDRRVVFIHQKIVQLNLLLKNMGKSLLVLYGRPDDIFKKLIQDYPVDSVYANHDYEPYAIHRDENIKGILNNKGISFYTYKDQVLFEGKEVIKADGTPYKIFTPYSKAWLKLKHQHGVPEFPSADLLENMVSIVDLGIPSLAQMGFTELVIDFDSDEIQPEILRNYAETRNFPGLDQTSRLGLHLRFGTISVRDCIRAGEVHSSAWLNELIWREFFMQILFHYPLVADQAFKPRYDRIEWRNNVDEFELWCKGKTGFPLVDAGMRELEQTGFMHNRVRMVVASFLTKHLLIDWRWGEAWFAEKLLDFELSSNNGNWQWAAGSGCDAAPYFRIFNPTEQLKKFDKTAVYVKRWVPEYETLSYPQPMVDHPFARQRCLKVYADALNP
ncbi:MAG: deoxyribodipyrimidine photo-lyase [Lentimicrobium sp.]|jgi:deoxyribodipyrimidine photo-lyase|nr:deoxyribodipyrimidine photo-lyase [Lentimicrobium sp.]